jgi:hypothetical protein
VKGETHNDNIILVYAHAHTFARTHAHMRTYSYLNWIKEIELDFLSLPIGSCSNRTSLKKYMEIYMVSQIETTNSGMAHRHMTCTNYN